VSARTSQTAMTLLGNLVVKVVMRWNIGGLVSGVVDAIDGPPAET
jgi:hypothetical protein